MDINDDMWKLLLEVQTLCTRSSALSACHLDVYIQAADNGTTVSRLLAIDVSRQLMLPSPLNACLIWQPCLMWLQMCCHRVLRDVAFKAFGLENGGPLPGCPVNICSAYGMLHT